MIMWIMVGFPCSGKSTIREDILKEHPNTVVISSDDIFEMLAEEYGISVNQAFVRFSDAPFINKMMHKSYADAIKNKLPILIDRTNLTKRARRRFNRPRGYKRIAVVVQAPAIVRWWRLIRREHKTGVTISRHNLKVMKRVYRPIDDTEDFDEIVIKKTFRLF